MAQATQQPVARPAGFLIVDDVFMDEEGTVWTRPTAYAYAQACKALRAKTDALHKVRNLWPPKPENQALEFSSIKEYQAWKIADDVLNP